jgi:UDP-glucuronate 4-epimerase
MILQIYKTTDCYRIILHTLAAIETALGKTAQKEYLPMQPGDVPRTEADVTDLVEHLGYKPNTPVQKGIERFIEWYKQYFSNVRIPY